MRLPKGRTTPFKTPKTQGIRFEFRLKRPLPLLQKHIDLFTTLFYTKVSETRKRHPKYRWFWCSFLIQTYGPLYEVKIPVLDEEEDDTKLTEQWVQSHISDRIRKPRIIPSSKPGEREVIQYTLFTAISDLLSKIEFLTSGRPAQILRFSVTVFSGYERNRSKSSGRNRK